jgi:tRNA threonylcarbamoyladenosine biosynthesis protein TsaB
LGIDTTTKISSVALADTDFDVSRETSDLKLKSDIAILSEIHSGGNITHSENLCPMVDCALATAGINLSEVNLFAVTVGPGSFTGIRIGVSLVKGLAYGSDNNCIGLSSLHVLAYNLNGFINTSADTKKIFIAPAIDARRKQVYNAIFSLSDDGEINYIKNDRIITVAELETELNSEVEFADSNIIFVGDGADMCYNELKLEKINKIRAGSILCQPNASSVCRLAVSELEKGGKSIHPRILSPSYLIKTQAEKELGGGEKCSGCLEK